MSAPIPAAEAAPPPKMTLPPFWKWLMRLTFAITLLLFLTPTFYAIKYYAIDKPREDSYAKELARTPLVAAPIADALPWFEERAQDRNSDARVPAIRQIGTILRYRNINYWNPIECLSAKATLSELAARDPNPTVRAAASEELGKVAQGGAVIRR